MQRAHLTLSKRKRKHSQKREDKPDQMRNPRYINASTGGKAWTVCGLVIYAAYPSHKYVKRRPGMPTFNFLDLPSGVFLYIISFLKDAHALTPLRLVCRSFNVYVCEAMFETLVINGGPYEDPLELLGDYREDIAMMYYVNRLAHQLDTLHTKKQPAALRRAKALKISVSGVFRYSKLMMSKTIGLPVWPKELQSAVHNLTIKLPSIIESLGNLRETTIYLSAIEREEFTLNISNALLTLPHLSTLNINFLDDTFLRSLPIVGSPRLTTLKISWPLVGLPDSPFVPEPANSPIYSQIFGATAKNTSLKCLELRSANRLLPPAELYQLRALPYLEQLVIDNVPVSLSGDIVKEMRDLQSLRLAYGGLACSNGELIAEVWESLKDVGTKLKHLSVDMVGEALLTYLRSYAGLETLELTLMQDAEFLYVQDLVGRSLRHHEESLESLQIYIHPHSDPLSTWFFEYWKEWIPPLRNLHRMEVTTSMNLLSEHDVRVLVKNITDVIVLIPTLRIIKIRHPHEHHPFLTFDKVIARVMQEEVESTRLHGDYTTMPQCVVDIRDLPWTFRVEYFKEEGYGSLKVVCNYRD